MKATQNCALSEKATKTALPHRGQEKPRSPVKTRQTCAPPLLMTKLQLSSLSSAAPARFIVPLQVWAISACDLRVDRLLNLLFHAPRTNFKVRKLYHCSVAWFQSLLEPRDQWWLSCDKPPDSRDFRSTYYNCMIQFHMSIKWNKIFFRLCQHGKNNGVHRKILCNGNSILLVQKLLLLSRSLLPW